MKSKKIKLEYRTVFLSDTHLGMRETGIQKLNHFLSHISCKTLVLNGDFIDGWALEGSGEWKKAHTRCVRLILKMVEKEKTRVVYLRGNHDDFLSKILPYEGRFKKSPSRITFQDKEVEVPAMLKFFLLIDREVTNVACSFIKDKFRKKIL